MEKRYTHLGIPIMVFMLLMYLFFLAIWVICRGSDELFYPCLFSTAGLLFGLLCVYNITITIDGTYISFKLGIGLIKKRYEIASIKSCEPVSGIVKKMGIGTKMTFAGDVLKYYIVTGFKAIDLRFYDSNTIVRIGTPLPEEISQQVQLLIGRAPHISLD